MAQKPAWLAEKPEKVPLTLANKKAKIPHSKFYNDYYALKPGSKSYFDLKEEHHLGDIVGDDEEKNIFKELVRSVLDHISKEYPNDFTMKDIKITDYKVYLEREQSVALEKVKAKLIREGLEDINASVAAFLARKQWASK